MKLISPAFSEKGIIPTKYTCEGENINPPLEIEGGLPSKAKGFALTVFDPDAPGDGWVHWTICNINSSVRSIGEGEIPEGSIQGVTDFGTSGYGGPCPPSGEHRYEFVLYVLDSIIEESELYSMKDLKESIKEHILEESKLTGLYRKTLKV